MHTTPIPLTEENLPALMDKHRTKIDSAVGNDSDKQQARLRLFEHDPAALAAHYPELQQKSEELRVRNDAVRSSAGIVGVIAFLGTAAFTGYKAFKKKISPSNLIQGIVVALSSITAGLTGNYIADRLLGASTRKESKDLATASRIAYERELAPYMEDTHNKLAANAAEEVEQKTAPSQVQPRDASFAAQTVAEKSAQEQSTISR